MLVVNRIAECGGWEGSTSGERSHIALHRIGGDKHPGLADAVSISAFFRNNPEHTGGEMPYPFVVLPSGVVEQALPLDAVSPHARRWNIKAVGVAAIGDFRKQVPPRPQWLAAVSLCAALNIWMGDDKDRCWGHDEYPNGSKFPDKKCPGRYWNMDDFRRDVRHEMTVVQKTQAEMYLLRHGIRS